MCDLTIWQPVCEQTEFIKQSFSEIAAASFMNVSEHLNI